MINPYKGGHDRLPGSGIQPGEKKKLWIFAILFVLVLAAFFGAQIMGQMEDDEKDGEDRGAVLPDKAPDRDEAGQPLMKVKAPDVDDRRDLTVNDIRTRLSELGTSGDLRDDDSSDSRAVLDYLLNQVLYETAVTSVSEMNHRVLPEEEAGYDPGPLRARFTSAFGKIVAVADPIAYEGEVESVDTLYPVLFRTADGALYRLLSTTKIERKTGDWIQAYGLFYRLMDVEVDGEEEKAFCLIATKKSGKAFPPVTVTEIDPEWEKWIQENDSDLARGVDEKSFWLLLNYVRNLGLEGFRAQKAAGEIEFDDFSDVALDLSRNPDLYRFRHVKLDGRVVGSYPNYLHEDNPGKIEEFWNATLVQPSNYLVQLVSPIPWAEYDMTVGDDFVRVEGVFYKRYQYVPRGGGEAVEVPMVVVTDVIRYVPEESSLTKILPLVFAGAAVLIIVAFLFFALRNAKERREFRERVLQKKRDRERLKGGGAAGGGESS